MKKISLAILTLIVVLASCKKTPEVNLKYVDVERDLITVGTTTATVQCDYQYIATLKKACFHYGEGENEADMNTTEMRVVQNTLYVELDGLRANTTYSYYYEFYNGFNSMRTVVKTFMTETLPIALPTVVTATVIEITTTSAKGGGEVTDDGGAEVTERGICWSTNENPTLNDNHVAAGTGIGSFTAAMNALETGTTYHVRAYAINEKGTAYGLDREFTTSQTEGEISGDFSVSETCKVRFSKGNLQYKASTNTWRFAESQWDFVGEDNSNASSTYDGWIDLYEWGTSGFDHGANHYLPWSTGGWNYDWAAYGDDEFDLCDRSGQADWGYNAISNGGNHERQWRTCKTSEWQYLLFDRQTASGVRFAKAVVNGINGVVLLPDNWASSVFELNNFNDGSASYEGNVISLEAWTDCLEANGAVFLPAAGRTCNYGIDAPFGGYWTASHGPTPWLKDLLEFDSESVHFGSYYPNYKRSVRLVRALANASFTIEAVSNPANAGTVEGSGIYDYYTAASLTAIPNEGYTFYCWKEIGRIVSTDNIYEVLALFDRNMEACFVENSTYPLHYSFNDNDHTATVIGHWEGVELTGELVIPEIVMHVGESYLVTSIGQNAFSDCSGLTSVLFPSSLVSIGNWAFSHTSLTEITIPSSVRQIGINPFHYCTNLAQITVELGNPYYDSRNNCNAIIETASNSLISGSLNAVIPNSVIAICRDAFLQIPITTISIPASVVRMDMSAFALTSLSEITIYAEIPPVLHEGSFTGVDKTIPVYIPSGTLSAYQNAEGWNEFTNFIEMP